MQMFFSTFALMMMTHMSFIGVMGIFHMTKVFTVMEPCMKIHALGQAAREQNAAHHPQGQDEA
jgi:hypothetical protein